MRLAAIGGTIVAGVVWNRVLDEQENDRLDNKKVRKLDCGDVCLTV